jgi:hypothetical protein
MSLGDALSRCIPLQRIGREEYFMIFPGASLDITPGTGVKDTVL